MNYTFFSIVGIIYLFILAAPGQDTAEKDAAQLAQKAQELGKEKKFDEAVAAMKKAVELAPRNDLYLATLSDFELKAGKFADGVEHALQAVKLNDKVGQYHILVASNAYADQDLERARRHCELVLKGGPKEFGPGPCNDARMLQDMMVKQTCTLTWNLEPQRARVVGGSIAVAMPRDNLPSQTVTFEITGARSQRLVKGDVNDILYIVPQGNTPITLTTKVVAQPYSFKRELAAAGSKALPAEAKAYLGPCYSIDPKSPVLKKLAAELKGSTSVDTARNILTWMKKNVEYRLEKKSIEELDFKSVDEIVQRGHAECRGYAMLFTALCRAADIPSRPMWGLILVTPEQSPPAGKIASHNWAEFYVPGCGWVPVDPQRPETLGFLPTSCVRIFMDVKKTKTSLETLPVFNLLSMTGDRLKFEVSR